MRTSVLRHFFSQTHFEINDKPVEFLTQKYKKLLSSEIFAKQSTVDAVLDKQTLKRYQDTIGREQEMKSKPRKEFIVIGRSNVGKSSLINALFGRNVAEISNYPGKTRNLYFYKLEDNRFMIDSPGYGFAKGNKKDVENWGQMMQQYLYQSTYLKQAYILIDAEHGYSLKLYRIKEVDLMTIQMLNSLKKPFTICYTKCDKVKHLDPLKQLTIDKIKDLVFASAVIHLTSQRQMTGIREMQSNVAYYCE